MKKLLLVLCLSVPLFAEYVNTPFGRAWVGPGPEPKAPVAKPVQAPKPFLPTFEKNVLITTNSNGKIETTPVNEWYFATKATADTLCRKFLCLAVVSEPMFTSGPYSCSANQRFLIWADGLKENAGILAAFYTRNPEDKFPGLAERFIHAVLQQDRDAKKAK